MPASTPTPLADIQKDPPLTSPHLTSRHLALRSKDFCPLGRETEVRASYGARGYPWNNASREHQRGSEAGEEWKTRIKSKRQTSGHESLDHCLDGHCTLKGVASVAGSASRQESGKCPPPHACRAYGHKHKAGTKATRCASESQDTHRSPNGREEASRARASLQPGTRQPTT